jgi:hypothetical protein
MSVFLPNTVCNKNFDGLNYGVGREPASGLLWDTSCSEHLDFETVIRQEQEEREGVDAVVNKKGRDPGRTPTKNKSSSARSRRHRVYSEILFTILEVSNHRTKKEARNARHAESKSCSRDHNCSGKENFEIAGNAWR